MSVHSAPHRDCATALLLDMVMMRQCQNSDHLAMAQQSLEEETPGPSGAQSASWMLCTRSGMCMWSGESSRGPNSGRCTC